jgi:predicted transposase YbfD/YdcC
MDDPRIERTKKHRLLDILFISLVATMCGCNTWVDVVRFARAKKVWFKRFIRLSGGIPSHDTFCRFFSTLKAPVLEACSKKWMHSLDKATGGGQIAIDGKTWANSLDKSSGQSALHLLCAWSVKARVVLGQEATDQKSSEVIAIPELLEQLELKGSLVTIDAMGCQTDIAQKIHEGRADYVLAQKANHPKLHEAVSDVFVAVAEDTSNAKDVRRMKVVDESGDRRDEREYVVMPIPKDLPGRENWPGLESIGMVVRRRITPKGETGQVRYSLRSLPAKVREFATAVRSHWSIENKPATARSASAPDLHWSLDVTFSEDKSRIHKGEGPEVVAWLRRLVLPTMKHDTSMKESLRGERFILGWGEEALERMLASFNRNEDAIRQPHRQPFSPRQRSPPCRPPV